MPWAMPTLISHFVSDLTFFMEQYCVIAVIVHDHGSRVASQILIIYCLERDICLWDFTHVNELNLK